MRRLLIYRLTKLLQSLDLSQFHTSNLSPGGRCPLRKRCRVLRNKDPGTLGEEMKMIPPAFPLRDHWPFTQVPIYWGNRNIQTFKKY